MSGIEALYIFDEQNAPILSHVWNGRPPSPQILLPLYITHPAPRPSLMYLSSTNPPTVLHSIAQDGLLFLCPTSSDTDPLSVLEFLHRVADALEDFLGSPLLSSRISSSYDVVAQLLGEMCDCGTVSTTEPNALSDLVEAPSWTSRLLGNVGLPSSPPSLASPSGTSSFSALALQSSSISSSSSNNAPAIPWRKSNVKHTSNEMYVDILETIHVTTSPSGQPLTAFSHGSVLFTAKVSGLPDLILVLGSQAGGPTAVSSTLDLPVFHPCVRLSRWKDRPGELSFVPPDGRFLLMGYEVDLLGPDHLEHVVGKGKTAGSITSNNLHIPAQVSVRTGLGSTGAEFEVRLSVDPKFATAPAASTKGDAFSKPSGLAAGRLTGTSAHPSVENLTVRVPIPSGVRSLTEMKASRGDARWAPGEEMLEWRISGKDITSLSSSLHSSSAGVVATLRCMVTGALEDDDDGNVNAMDLTTTDKWSYDEMGDGGKQGRNTETTAKQGPSEELREEKRMRANRSLMPSSATVSFQVKGWLASGLRVEKLVIDNQRSRGLGAGVQPYKGVKYLTVSKDGVETRC